MFSFRSFVKTGFLKAIGVMPDYWIILNAAGYMEKSVLLEEDLAEIQLAIEEHTAALETAQPVTPVTESQGGGSADGEGETPEEENTRGDAGSYESGAEGE